MIRSTDLFKTRVVISLTKNIENVSNTVKVNIYGAFNLSCAPIPINIFVV